MRRTITAGLVALTASTGLLMGGAAQGAEIQPVDATAGTTWRWYGEYNTEAGWSEQNFTGEKIQWYPVYASTNRCKGLPFVARSAVNNTNENQRGFSNNGCSGPDTVLFNKGNSARSIVVSSYLHT